MKSIFKLLLAGILILINTQTFAVINIFACEPEWAALAKEIGGEHVTTFSATNAFQDPHHIEAKPSLIARMRNADLIVCSGAELEVGWLPLLLSQSGNNKIQLNSPGYLEIANYVTRIEVPAKVDRSEGDVHASGNPHVHLDPRNFVLAADTLTKRLSQIDPVNAQNFQNRNKTFQQKWQAAIKKWEADIRFLKGKNVIVHHKEFSYLFNWLEMNVVGSLEPKPGMEPTAAHLSKLVEKASNQNITAVIYSSHNDPRAAKWFSEKTKVLAVMLPLTIGGSDNAKDLFGLFDDLIQRLAQVTK